MIQNKKIMLMISLNPLSLYVLKDRPKGNNVNVQYYRDSIFAELIHIRPERDERKFYVHTDNTSLHIANTCRFLCDENQLSAYHQAKPSREDELIDSSISL
jgi:hypothetical protein